MRTPSLPMANLVPTTHPMGFEQIAERVVGEIVHEKKEGVPISEK